MVEMLTCNNNERRTYMIDNGKNKAWTLFSYRPEPTGTGWVVVGTKWTDAGPTSDERIVGGYESEQAAREASVKHQREYDKLRDVLYRSAKAVNGGE